MNQNLSQTEVARMQIDKLNINSLSKEEANRIGYFSTPFSLAKSIVIETKKYLKNKTDFDVLEPGFGTGAFTSALLNSSLAEKINKIVGVEVDKNIASKAKKLWSKYPVKINTKDYLATPLKQDFDLLIYNPPYSRFHHIPWRHR